MQAELVKKQWVHKAGHAFDLLDQDRNGELDQADIDLFLKNRQSPGLLQSPARARDDDALPGPH